jgi:hypothetical protein
LCPAAESVIGKIVENPAPAQAKASSVGTTPPTARPAGESGGRDRASEADEVHGPDLHSEPVAGQSSVAMVSENTA